MKKSIRTNLFLLFAALMVTFVLTGVLLSELFLERYYVIKNEDALSAVASEVKMSLNTTDVQQELEDIDRANGVSITVADQEHNVLLTSFAQKKGDNIKIPKEIEQLISNSNFNAKSAVYSTVGNAEEQPKLAYITQTDEGLFVIVTKSMKGIVESTEIANQFYIFAGVFALVIGSLFMFKFSGAVTKPIIEMSWIARDISNLHFDKKVKVKNKDELGILADSINSLSDKLKTSIQGLRQDIEFQKNLSRNMSHELKTPIGVIKGYAEGLSFGVADNPEMKEKYLGVIIDECDRMDRLVMEMLELSKLEAQNYTLQNVVRFQLCSLFLSVKERFEQIIEEENIRFLWECSDEIYVFANYEQLERALSNLVSNAVKYADENKYVKLSAAEDSDAVTITVFNTCPPIPDDEIGKLFDAFYKVEKARTRERGGHGLGLSIVKSIVELHGGKIAAQNKKGGVEFTVTLPKSFI